MRQYLVDTARSYLGAVRGDAKHREIIDTYNSILPRPRGYKMSYKDAWCAAFVSAMAIKCGLTSIIPVECSCNEQIALLKKLNEWHEADDYTPSIGDLVYYDWQDSGKGDNQGWADHVGIVCDIDKTTNPVMFRVIEGNKGGMVDYRTMSVNGRYIRGFGLPDFDKALHDWTSPFMADSPEETLFRFWRWLKNGV